MPAPTYILWLFSVGATEISLYFGLLGCLGAVLGVFAFRRRARRSGVFAAIFGASAAALSLIPYGQSLPVAAENQVALSFAEYFGIAPADAGVLSTAPETYLYAVSGGQRLFLDFYRPKGNAAEGHHAALVVVHGGSWRQGSRSDFARWDRYLAAQGYAVFDIDYRLAPQPNWKTATADVQTAVAYVRANALRFQVDSDRIALLGRSAGGHLALLAAYTARPASRVRCVVSLYGPTDLVWGYEHVAHPDVIHGRETLTRFLGGTLPAFPATYVAASPVTYASAASPPTLLFHGERDRLVGSRHSVLLADRLRQTGNTHSRLVLIPYALHGFDYVFDGWGAQIVRPVLLRFLHENLQ